jgi:hypothetical protein
MESRGMHCSRCNKDTQHTFRYHITKTKHYSVVSVGSGKKEITVVCHVCLLETSIEKKDSKELVKQYDNEIAVGEANELLDKEKYSKAERKLRKVLNKDPEFPQALYSISKCLISQAKYDEAEYQIRILENKFPDIPEIKELRDSLPPKLGTVEPKQAEVKPAETAKSKPTLPKGSTPKPAEISSVVDTDTIININNANVVEPKPAEISSVTKHSNENSEKICNDCYHEEKQHGALFDKHHELICSGCSDDGLTVCCKEFSEKPAEVKPAETAKSKPTLPKGSTPKPEVKPAETAKPKPTLPKGSTPKPEVKPAETAKPKPTLPKGSTPKPTETAKPKPTLPKASTQKPELTSNYPFEGITNNEIATYSDLFDIPPPETDAEAIKTGKKIRDWIKNGKPDPVKSTVIASDEKDVVKSEYSEQLDEKVTIEKMDEEEVDEYLKLIEELQKVGLGNSNNLIELKQMLVKDGGLDENNLQYLTELDVQLDKQVNEITKSEKNREKRQKEGNAVKKIEAEMKLEESERRVEEAEMKLEEKKKKKEEESRKKREIDKQIAINEEKIRKIEEESKRLDEED